MLEQMLGLHPDIAPRGELPHWRDAAAALPASYLRGDGPWYAHLDRFSETILDRVGTTVLKQFEAGGSAKRIIDKNPSNFAHLPLIGMAWPNVRVLHCVRDPLDTGWSCFRQQFSSRLPWATSLESIGYWIRAERRLMAHWRAVLPIPILTVKYEALVESPDAVLRAVTAFLGVGWCDEVLRPELSARAVATASYGEVKDPVHRRSVGRAAPYRAHLGRLEAALQGA